jgi:uncharacterized protein
VASAGWRFAVSIRAVVLRQRGATNRVGAPWTATSRWPGSQGGPTRPASAAIIDAMELGKLETSLREFFAPRPTEIVAVYLFGSQARQTALPTSDVDIAVLLREAPAPTLNGLPLDVEADLERSLGLPVQAVVLNHAPVDLVHRVLRDGKLVVDRDPSARIRFEVKARNEFFDLQPVLARYRAPRAPGR